MLTLDTKSKILEIASKETKFKTSDVVKSLRGNVSRQFISYEINNLVKQGILVKGGSTKNSFYTLPSNAIVLGTKFHKRLTNKDLKEHEVFDKLQHQNGFNTIKIVFFNDLMKKFNCFYGQFG